LKELDEATSQKNRTCLKKMSNGVNQKYIKYEHQKVKIALILLILKKDITSPSQVEVESCTTTKEGWMQVMITLVVPLR